MPQLVFADYAPQVVWLAITLCVLLLILSRLAFPGIARTLGDRDARLTGDIEAAERLRAEAESALGAYQKIIAEARQKAQAELKKASVTLAAEAARQLVTRLAGAEPVAAEVTSALAAAERDSR